MLKPEERARQTIDSLLTAAGWVVQHRDELDEFVACYNPYNRYERQPTWTENNPDGRWRSFEYDELMARDKVSLDIFWLRDESLEDNASLPDPDVIATEIMADLEVALEQFRQIAEQLGVEE